MNNHLPIWFNDYTINRKRGGVPVYNTIQVGTIAPDFTLKNQHGELVNLRKLNGKKVILAFHPLAFTRICTYQMQDLETHKEDFIRLNTIALGISVDPQPSKHAWAKDIGIKDTSLLADFWPHGAVAIAYGIFRGVEGSSERATIIIDEESIIRWFKIYPTKERPDINEIITELQKF